VAKEKVVVIEDEPDILEVVRYNLAREHYDVHGVRDGEQGLATVRKQAPDLVILDLMLPGMDGIEVCRRLRADPLTSGIPVMMLTAKGEESDVVLGLGVGADDYVTKPFSPKVLVARVRALLRRGGPKDERAGTDRLVRPGLVIDAARHEVLVDGKPVTLTASEFRLLHFLAAHPGRVFSRDQLLSKVVGDDVIVIERNVDVHVGAVRKKLGSRRECIETVRGVGYRFRDQRQ
jgi:two-component system phosphate regulon response regulator PhoB